MSRKKTAFLVFAVALVTGASTAAIAGHVAGHTVKTGKSVTAVKVVRNTQADTTNSTSFALVDGMKTTISVPAGTNAILLAEYTAESSCEGNNPGFPIALDDWCTVRITVNGTELQPSGGADFAFDSPDGGNETGSSWEGHALSRSSNVLGPGNYTVRVQFATTDAATTLRVDDSHLTVMRIAT